jgi:hypothetical protein
VGLLSLFGELGNGLEMSDWQFAKDQGPATLFVVVVLWWFHKKGWPFIEKRVEKSDEQRRELTEAVKESAEATRALSSKMDIFGAALAQLHRPERHH